MGKSTKALALTAGIAGAAGFAALTAAPEQVSASTGTVTYNEGATTVWQTPAFQQAKRYVVYNQQIEIQGQKTVNGTVWYQIGANEWIPELYLQLAGSQSAATTTTATQAATASAASQAGSFNLTVTYTGGATTVWTGTSYSAPTGRYLTAGQTVTAVAKTVSAGETWYKLSTGGYVPGRFASENGAASVTTTPATTTPAPATSTTTANTTTTTPATSTPATSTPATTPAASTPATSTPATSTPATSTPAASAPATSTPATSTPAATTPAVTAGSYNLTITNSGNVVTVWATPAYSKASRYLASGAKVTANGTVVVAGETWYQLSSGGFVPAQFATTGSTTPAPSTPSTSTSTSSNSSATTNTSKPSTSTPTPAPAPSTTSHSAKVQAVLNLANKLKGTPYVWGGTSLSGFDCSGFTQYVLQHAIGLSVNRTAQAQANQFAHIAVSQAQAGDLLFWTNSTGVYHVAFALGNGQYIAAPKPGDVVKVGSLQYFPASFAARAY